MMLRQRRILIVDNETDDVNVILSNRNIHDMTAFSLAIVIMIEI